MSVARRRMDPRSDSQEAAVDDSSKELYATGCAAVVLFFMTGFVEMLIGLALLWCLEH